MFLLYAQHPERVGLKKSKNCQKGGVQKSFSIKGRARLDTRGVAKIKRVGLLTLTN